PKLVHPRAGRHRKGQGDRRHPRLGGRLGPLRYCRFGKYAGSAAPCRTSPAQSVGLPGPPVTVTITLPPAFTAVTLTVSVGAAALPVTARLAPFPYTTLFRSNRNSYTPGLVGIVKVKAADDSPGL